MGGWGGGGVEREGGGERERERERESFENCGQQANFHGILYVHVILQLHSHSFCFTFPLRSTYV